LTVIVAGLLNFTRWGYEIRVAGSNPQAAKYAGMPFRRHLITVMLLSGAIAVSPVCWKSRGTVHRLQGGISNNFGYLGIMVAVLARGSALGSAGRCCADGGDPQFRHHPADPGPQYLEPCWPSPALILFFTAIGDESRITASFALNRPRPERPAWKLSAGLAADLDPRRRRTGAGGAR